jgi:hypothetical protein
VRFQKQGCKKYLTPDPILTSYSGTIEHGVRNISTHEYKIHRSGDALKKTLLLPAYHVWEWIFRGLFKAHWVGLAVGEYLERDLCDQEV